MRGREKEEEEAEVGEGVLRTIKGGGEKKKVKETGRGGSHRERYKRESLNIRVEGGERREDRKEGEEEVREGISTQSLKARGERRDRGIKQVSIQTLRRETKEKRRSRYIKAGVHSLCRRYLC